MNPNPIILDYTFKATTDLLASYILTSGRRKKPFRFRTGNLLWTSPMPNSLWYTRKVATFNV